MLTNLELTDNELRELKQQKYVVIEREGYTFIIKRGEIPLDFIAALINYALRISE